MEYPGIPRQASYSCVVQNNWQFSLSAKILQIASRTQKHLADPVSISCVQDVPGTISEKTTKNRNIQHANSWHLIHAQRLPRIMFGKAWLCVGSTGNSSRAPPISTWGVGRFGQTYKSCNSSEQLALFMSSAKSSGLHPARTSTLPPGSVRMPCVQKLLRTIREKAV